MALKVYQQKSQRFSPELFAAITEAAERAGMKVNPWIERACQRAVLQEASSKYLTPESGAVKGSRSRKVKR